jgi:hypothetical protein
MPLGVFAQNIKQFGLGMPTPLQMSDLPASKLLDKLNRLSPTIQEKALKKLRGMSFTDQDIHYLQVDDNGGVLFSDSFLPPALPIPTPASDTLPTSQISKTDAFSLHSKPGAKNIIYLDFDGMDITNTAWNEGRASTLYAQAYDTDSSPGTFSDSELNAIAEIWHRIAEDYMPFNVDVTTKKPNRFGATVGRILITKNVDKKQVAMPSSSSGGIAYADVWGYPNYAYYSPALVYYNNLGNGYAPYVAEAGAHEMGHNLGLSHDGTSTTGYYAGLGSGAVSWAPIMGSSYSKNVTQWSKGEYPDANQKQDDVAIIKAKLAYRPDDHGNNISGATPLAIGGDGVIAATNTGTDPHNTDKANKGIIGRQNDVDYFSFSTGAGPINITVTPAWDAFYRDNQRGANLDIQAILYDWSGQFIQRFDPINETKVLITKTLSGGQYFLAIRGVGNKVTPYSKYDSLGQYFIRGTVTP